MEEEEKTGLLRWLKKDKNISPLSAKKAQEKEAAKKVKRHKQAIFAHTVNTAQIPEENGTQPIISSRRVAMGPNPPKKQVKEVLKNDFFSTEPAQTRLKRLGKIQIESTIPPQYFPNPEIEKKSSEPTIEPVIPPPQNSDSELPIKPDNLKKKRRKLDVQAAYKSLKNAESEWKRKENSPSPKQPKQQTSVPPFKQGDYPSLDKGLDKWQPREGAIKGEALKEVWEQSKEIAEPLPSRPEPKIEKKIPTYTPQKREKVPA